MFTLKLLQMEKRAIHSERVKGGGRTYFLDHRQSEKGVKYLTIAESQKGEDGNFETRRIVIFESDVDSFRAAFNRLVDNFHLQRENG